MRTALYVIWALLPLFFFILALWAALEKYSKSTKRQNPRDFLRQGLFVLACILVSVAIDQYILESIVDAISPSWIPLGFYQILLLPLILLGAAHLLGPTKTIGITKVPSPTAKHRRR